ncbi:AIPR family protein [Deinococcus wulumuqiensis]
MVLPGNTSVNEKITQSLTEQPDLFLYLNNGLTAYCQRLAIPAADRARPEAKRLEIKGISIVNGAQTLGVIAQVRQNGSEVMPGHVFMRIISMERAEDERELGQKITFSTNFQNQVNWRDFASLDPHQSNLADQLGLSGVHYHYRDADNTPDPDDENFDFQEALLALACLERDASCDFCARAQSNRQSLASPEPVYPATEQYLSRYHRLFSPDKPAEHVWRAVQVLRTVKTRMTENVRQSDGRRKAFFKDAKYLVAHLLFVRKEPHKGTTLTLTTAEIQAVRNEADTISEALWAAYDAEVTLNTRSPASVFSSASDCQFLKGKTMQRLTARPSIPSQTIGNPSQSDILES